MGATAIAPVAIKASALIPKPDIATAIQKKLSIFNTVNTKF